MSFIPSSCSQVPYPNPAPLGCGHRTSSLFAMPSKTSIEWALANPVLGEGAFAYESDTGKWKLGNGTDRYVDLQYQAETGAPGAEGPAGPAGPSGQVGPPCTLKIGSVTSGATASASISGKAPNYLLNLVLPTSTTTNPVDPTTPDPSKPGVITFSATPVSRQVQEGFAVVFSVEAQCSPADTLTYQWQRQEGYGGTWVDVATGNGPRLVFNAKVSDNADNFRCLVSANSANAAYSPAASLTVFPLPPANGNAAIILQPLPVWCRAGDQVSFACALNSGNGGTQIANYRWRKKLAGGAFVDVGNGSPVLSFQATQQDNGATIACSAWYSVPGGFLYPGIIPSQEAVLTII